MVKPPVIRPPNAVALTCEGCIYGKMNHCMILGDLIVTDAWAYCSCSSKVEEREAKDPANLKCEPDLRSTGIKGILQAKDSPYRNFPPRAR